MLEWSTRCALADFIELVRPLGAKELELDDRRVRRFIEVAIRHANDHRSAIRDRLLPG
jgi:hypothetical protein